MATRRTILAALIAALIVVKGDAPQSVVASRPPDGLVFCPDCQPEVLAGLSYYTRENAGHDAGVFVGNAQVLYAYAAHPGDAEHGWYLTHLSPPDEHGHSSWPTCPNCFPWAQNTPLFYGFMMRVVHADVIVTGVGEVT